MRSGSGRGTTPERHARAVLRTAFDAAHLVPRKRERLYRCFDALAEGPRIGDFRDAPALLVRWHEGDAERARRHVEQRYLEPLGAEPAVTVELWIWHRHRGFLRERYDPAEQAWRRVGWVQSPQMRAQGRRAG